jgi:Kef-type K+ transport system membrane component KefB
MNTYHLLIILPILLLSAKLLGFLFKKINIPPVLGELCAGIVLGPSLLGLITPDKVLNILAEIGVVFLLFEVGLHTNVSRLLNTGKKPVIVAFIGFILPIILGFGMARCFDFSNLCALFIGGTLSATSIGISLRVLGDLNKQHTHEAQIVLGAAILDDIFGVLLLSILYSFAVQGTVSPLSVLILGSSTLLFIWLAPIFAKILFWSATQYVPAKAFTPFLLFLSLLFIFVFSLSAHCLGAPPIIGGFVAGIALSRQFGIKLKNTQNSQWIQRFNTMLKVDNTYFARLEKQIAPFIKIFTPIFFVMVGVSINFREIQGSSTGFWLLALSLFVVALLSKFLSGFFIKEPRKLQTLVGVAMVPRGEVGLIFASLGLSAGIFTSETYACLVFVVALTTFLPPFLLQYLYR